MNACQFHRWEVVASPEVLSESGREQVGCRVCGQTKTRAVKAERSKPAKRSQLRRDWTSARAKVEAEGKCRLGGRMDDQCQGKLEAAHIIGRDRDLDSPNGMNPLGHDPNAYFVMPDRIVPLCSVHHRLYDAGDRDLLGRLTAVEEAQAVLDSSVNNGPGLESARRRLAPSGYSERRRVA